MFLFKSLIFSILIGLEVYELKAHASVSGFDITWIWVTLTLILWYVLCRELGIYLLLWCLEECFLVIKCDYLDEIFI